MPLYKMLVIAAHNPQYIHIKELVRQSALQILDNGGVVRALDYLGTQTLPQKMRRHKQIFDHGDYWTISFDSSPKSQKTLSSFLRKDPRVIRSTVFKMGERPEEIIDISASGPGHREVTLPPPATSTLSTYYNSSAAFPVPPSRSPARNSTPSLGSTSGRVGASVSGAMRKGQVGVRMGTTGESTLPSVMRREPGAGMRGGF